MKIFLPLCIAIMVLVSGCALRPYKMQIEQGINITPAQVQELQIGMSQDQVSYILGTPNLTDPYHPNAWYYVYSNEENYEPRTQSTIIVNFDAAGRVSSFEEIPNGAAHS